MAGTPPKTRNYAEENKRWTDQTLMENRLVRHVWPQRWGFYVHEYRKLYKDLDTFHGDASEGSEPVRAEDVFKLPPIPKPVGPQTTTQMIGWRARHPQKLLDIYGPYTRGCRDIVRVFNWPRN